MSYSFTIPGKHKGLGRVAITNGEDLRASTPAQLSAAIAHRQVYGSQRTADREQRVRESNALLVRIAREGDPFVKSRLKDELTGKRLALHGLASAAVRDARTIRAMREALASMRVGDSEGAARALSRARFEAGRPHVLPEGNSIAVSRGGTIPFGGVQALVVPFGAADGVEEPFDPDKDPIADPVAPPAGQNTAAADGGTSSESDFWGDAADWIGENLDPRDIPAAYDWVVGQTEGHIPLTGAERDEAVRIIYWEIHGITSEVARAQLPSRRAIDYINARVAPCTKGGDGSCDKWTDGTPLSGKRPVGDVITVRGRAKDVPPTTEEWQRAGGQMTATARQPIILDRRIGFDPNLGLTRKDPVVDVAWQGWTVAKVQAAYYEALGFAPNAERTAMWLADVLRRGNVSHAQLVAEIKANPDDRNGHYKAKVHGPDDVPFPGGGGGLGLYAVAAVGFIVWLGRSRR